MATPIIQLDGSVSGAGTPGDSRDDFVAPEVITVIDTANPAPSTFSVILRARPPGSSAVISLGPGANEAQFTLDVDGTFLVEVIADGASSGVLAVLGGQDFFFSGQGGAASKLPNGFRPIAAGETIQFGPDGWFGALDAVIRASDRNLPSNDQKDAADGASPGPTGANPFVTEGNANIPSADQKTDLGQLDGAAEGTVWHADVVGRVARLAPGTSGQFLQTAGAGNAPAWADVIIATVTAPVRNESGSTLTKGTCVAVSGFSVPESRPLVVAADKDDPAKRPGIAMLTADLLNNSNTDGLVVGRIVGVDTSAFSLTDSLVLGNAGAFVRPPPDTLPFTGEFQSIGSVSRVGAADGEIIVMVGGLGLQFQRAFTEIGADTTTTSTVFVDLFSTTITKSALSKLACLFSVSISNSVATAQMTDFRLVVDGVVKRAASVTTNGADEPQSAALDFVAAAVPSGARVVKIQWRTTGGTAQIRPVAEPDREHASLLVQESAL